MKVYMAAHFVKNKMTNRGTYHHNEVLDGSSFGWFHVDRWAQILQLESSQDNIQKKQCGPL